MRCDYPLVNDARVVYCDEQSTLLIHGNNLFRVDWDQWLTPVWVIDVPSKIDVTVAPHFVYVFDRTAKGFFVVCRHTGALTERELIVSKDREFGMVQLGEAYGLLTIQTTVNFEGEATGTLLQRVFSNGETRLIDVGFVCERRFGGYGFLAEHTHQYYLWVPEGFVIYNLYDNDISFEPYRLPAYVRSNKLPYFLLPDQTVIHGNYLWKPDSHTPTVLELDNAVPKFIAADVEWSEDGWLILLNSDTKSKLLLYKDGELTQRKEFDKGFKDWYMFRHHFVGVMGGNMHLVTATQETVVEKVRTFYKGNHEEICYEMDRGYSERCLARASLCCSPFEVSL